MYTFLTTSQRPPMTSQLPTRKTVPQNKRTNFNQQQNARIKAFGPGKASTIEAKFQVDANDGRENTTTKSGGVLAVQPTKRIEVKRFFK